MAARQMVTAIALACLVTSAAFGDTIVLVNIGASVININVLSEGITAFTRDISMGGSQFTEEIQKQLNVSNEEAETLKLGGGSSADADSVVPQEVERVIVSVSEIAVP